MERMQGTRESFKVNKKLKRLSQQKENKLQNIKKIYMTKKSWKISVKQKTEREKGKQNSKKVRGSMWKKAYPIKRISRKGQKRKQHYGEFKGEKPLGNDA